MTPTLDLVVESGQLPLQVTDFKQGARPLIAEVLSAWRMN